MIAMRGQRGQAAVGGILAVLILVVVAATLTDVYVLYETRSWANRLAEESALAGASVGRDWTYAMTNGEMRLDAALAQTEATAWVVDEMAEQGITTYTADVRVLPNPSGGAITNFPPVAGANIFDEADWNSNEPAVGVYLEVPADTVFLRLVNGNQPVTLHVFAAAGVASLP